MGNSGGIPDIGVRLSAQGVQDVINAFARVRKEAKTTGVETAASLDLINGALEQLKELLPAISFAVIIDQVAQLGLNARETTEDLGKLSEKTGAAIGTLSALNLAAHDNEVSQESLSNALVKLAKNQQNATDGAVVQQKAFKNLGISLSDLKTQDPGQLFVTVAQKMASLPDGAQKAQIAIALFGKSGADLLPMLKSLGTDGFDATVSKAKQLGLYLSGDMVQSSMAAKDALNEIGDIADGIGTQFVTGFAPEFAQGIEMFAGALEGDGADSIKNFGETAGRIFKGIVAGILFIGDTVKLIFKNAALEMSNEFGQVKAGLVGLSQGGITGAITSVAGYNAQNGSVNNAAMQTNHDAWLAQYTALQAQYSAAPNRKAWKPNTGGGGGAGNGLSDQTAQKTAQARSSFLQAQADNELAILKLKNQLEEAEDQRSYAAGTLSLDDYYARREARIKAEGDAELAILETQREAALHVTSKDAADTKEKSLQVKVDNNTATIEDYKELTAAQKAETQATETQDATESKLTQNRLDRSNAIHALSLTELNDIEKLQKASGDKYGAEETALQIELQQYTELLEKQKKSTDEINAAVSAYKARAQATIDFGRNQEAGSSAMTNLNLGISGIQNQAASGSISNIEAQAQINQLQKDSLASLQQIGQQMLLNAELSQDPKAIEAAEQYNDGIQKIAVSLKNVTTAQTYFVNQLAGQGYTDLVNFFADGISGAKSFGEAMTDLGNQFAGIVGKMVSQLLVYYALAAVLGFVNDHTNIDLNAAVNNLQNNGPFSSNPLTSHASGGWTGDVPSDQVAGLVHGQEFVIKAGPAKEYRPFLEAMNAGKTPSILPVNHYGEAHISSYTASLTGAGVGQGSASPPIVQVINATGQQTTQKQTTGSGGQSITQIIVGTVAKDIAAGGQVAQTLQTSYGVTRQGTRRG